MNTKTLQCHCKKIEDMNKAEIKAEIKRIEGKINTLQDEMVRLEEVQDALVVVLENWEDSERPEDGAGFRRKRGKVIEKTFEIVSQSASRMSAQEVLEALRKKGFRSSGNQKNFPVTVSKSLRRLVQLGKIAEERTESGRVFYLAKMAEKQKI
jgi:hypothetical protein